MKVKKMLMIIVMMTIFSVVVNPMSVSAEEEEGYCNCWGLERTSYVAYYPLEVFIENGKMVFDFGEKFSGNYTLGKSHNLMGFKYKKPTASDFTGKCPSLLVTNYYGNNVSIRIPQMSQKKTIKNMQKNEIVYVCEWTKVGATTPEEQFTGNDLITGCDSLGKTTTFIKKIYNLIKFLVPVIIVVFGIKDFLGPVFSGDDKSLKQALNKFLKRVIIGIVFILTPFILSLFIRISGITEQYRDIDTDNLFCIFK